jgi:energy-coupling factor transporter ATP-binding protein EcfA2
MGDVGMTTGLDLALRYVRAGYVVFPCDPVEKIPVLTDELYMQRDGTYAYRRFQWRGLKAVTEAEVREWWARWPDAVPGFPTGIVNGVSVIDYDRIDGEAREDAQQRMNALQEMIAQGGGSWVGCMLVVTPSGGMHLCWRHVDGVGNARGDAMPRGIDVRGEGGYVIAPGTVRPDGKVYSPRDDPHSADWMSFDTFLAVGRETLPPFPKWIIQHRHGSVAAIGRSATAVERAPHELDWGEAAMAENIAEMRATGEGGRNERLNRIAFRTGRLLAAGYLPSVEEAQERLRDAALATGLEAVEVERTMLSGLSAGLLQPAVGPHEIEPDHPVWLTVQRMIERWARAAVEPAGGPQTAALPGPSESPPESPAPAAGPPARPGGGISSDAAALLDFRTLRVNAIVGTRAQMVKLTKAEYERAMPTGSAPFPVQEPQTTVPGAVGALARYFLEMSHRQTEIGALAAAFGVMSVLVGQGYATAAETRANLYITITGRSGSGKTQLLSAAKHLLSEVGMDELIGPEDFKSGSAITKMLAEQPVVLGMIDEFGHRVAQITNPRAPVHLKETLTAWTKLYSASSSVYAGDAFAGQERKPIHRPHMSLLTAATPGQLWEGFSSSAMEDGTMARFLVFPIEEVYVNEPDRTAPIRVAGVVREIRTAALNNMKLGDVVNGKRREIPLALSVPFEPEAARARDALVALASALSYYTDSTDLHGASAIQNRIPEQADKLALILAVGEDPQRPAISLLHYQIAASIARWCACYMIRQSEQFMAGSTFEKDCNRVMGVIQNAGQKGASRSILMNRIKIEPEAMNRVLKALDERRAIATIMSPRGVACYIIRPGRNRAAASGKAQDEDDDD